MNKFALPALPQVNTTEFMSDYTSSAAPLDTVLLEHAFAFAWASKIRSRRPSILRLIHSLVKVLVTRVSANLLATMAFVLQLLVDITILWTRWWYALFHHSFKVYKDSLTNYI